MFTLESKTQGTLGNMNPNSYTQKVLVKAYTKIVDEQSF
jgi:hypothetical protein